MDGEHATETAEKSGLVEPPILAVADASTTALLRVVQDRLDAEMKSAHCNQTEAALHAVTSVLEVLDARNRDRATAAKRE